MRVLYFDCFSGISGDMAVGALRDLGVEEQVFHEALSALKLGDELHAHFHREARQNIQGWKFDVHAHAHEHSHHHGHAAHTHGRTYQEIRELIAGSSLSEPVKRRSLAVFHRIALAEGKIHGVPAEQVAFHEVGAVDSLADIVAACAGLDALKVGQVFASRLVEGSGWVDCAHGRFPLPAPATLEILSGIPLREIEEDEELITPTGAALLAEFASSFGLMPELKIERVGYGLGTRDPSSRPNVLRAVLGEMRETPAAEQDKIVQIETNLDDLTPELAGGVMERLLGAGALDVFFTPIQMKKNRPGFMITVLAAEEKADELARFLLTETSAFGVRLHRARRLKLRREFRDVETPHGLVRVKLGFLGDKLVQVAPEFASCHAVAQRAGVSLRDVHFEALLAARRAIGAEAL